MGYWGFPEYVSVGEKRARAEKKIKQLKKKNPNLKPVIIEGKALAKTWWGKAWNKNLEQYADFSNRIGRGRSYVRHMAVLDLQMKQGEVSSLVQGSASRPYSVTVKIEKISGTNWDNLKKLCSGKFDSLQKLLSGKFPKALNEIFTIRNKGLFPAPKEIKFSCSCPDWAGMCKHVAATLYGIGARLDEDPGLFFKLRKVKVDDLISEAVADSAKEMLKKAKRKTGRVLYDSNLSNVFGIDLDDDEPDVSAKKTLPRTKAAKKKAKKKAAKKKTAGLKKSKAAIKKISGVPKKKPAEKKGTAAKSKNRAAITIIEKIIRRRTINGISLLEIKKRTGFNTNKIRNIIYKLLKHGRIKTISRGNYIRG